MKRALSLAAVVAFGLLLATISSTGSATSAVPGASGAIALERSGALADAPSPNRFAAGVRVPAAGARAFADGPAEEIPLPEGGSFDGIQWEPAGGEFPPSEVRLIMQYNAMCQWVRAYRDGRDVDVSGQVLADIPAWVAWRDAETGAILRTAIDELVAGGGPASAVLLAECDRSHEQEVRFAQARGLTPPR